MGKAFVKGAVLMLACLFAASAGKAAPDKEPAEKGSVAAKPAAPKAAKKAKAKEPPVYKDLKSALEKHIKAEADENDGLYTISDEDIDEESMLTLKRIDMASTRKVSNSKYIVRAEFVEQGDSEFGDRDVPVIIDFTLLLEKKKWAVRDAAVYSVDGVARFTYAADHSRKPIPRLEEDEYSTDEPPAETLSEPDIDYPVDEEGLRDDGSRLSPDHFDDGGEEQTDTSL